MKISKKQYTRLKQIKKKVDSLNSQVDELVEEAEEITQDKHANRTFDFMLNNFPESLDEALEHMKIEVE